MEQLRSLLNQQQVEYEIIQHTNKIHSAQEGADFLGIALGQTAPVLILKADNNRYYSLILSGDYGRVDLDELRELLQHKEIKLAKPQEVEQVTGCKIGDVSLINPNLPSIMDRGLYRFPYIYGGTGVPKTTLKISPLDVEKLNQVVGYLR
ncbi:aminoacyl-tRNA deacylase [Paenibacillus xylaniclasticus]|uniref:aminoacyl-tRNA deacylase n=1 Tax=Paenibacillus xylaniclasticus TaxID=588083 RepID=UPI000FD79D73|nr:MULTISPECIES: YbaK/EbsC family protein [Paenibacillus]GFN33476.1 hypothetical protein PCURB6_37360 [Paenibacillus curdlanolyticus]